MKKILDLIMNFSYFRTCAACGKSLIPQGKCPQCGSTQRLLSSKASLAQQCIVFAGMVPLFWYLINNHIDDYLLLTIMVPYVWGWGIVAAWITRKNFLNK
ncbi:hypothetical protein [Anaerospora hongkongensis]|uniref:hypothetical protein n=1 Tax=Anaerospora hongkongensis TaxID=244830 RepID=UPI002FD902CF